MSKRYRCTFTTCIQVLDKYSVVFCQWLDGYILSAGLILGQTSIPPDLGNSKPFGGRHRHLYVGIPDDPVLAVNLGMDLEKLGFEDEIFFVTSKTNPDREVSENEVDDVLVHASKSGLVAANLSGLEPLRNCVRFSLTYCEARLGDDES